MFIVIYSFKVKPDQVHKFEKAWKELTLLISEHEDSLGSRLHKQDALNYIAYAQWPDKNGFKNSGHKLPEISKDIKMAMKAACEEIEILHELELVEDLFKK